MSPGEASRRSRRAEAGSGKKPACSREQEQCAQRKQAGWNRRDEAETIRPWIGVRQRLQDADGVRAEVGWGRGRGRGRGLEGECVVMLGEARGASVGNEIVGTVGVDWEGKLMDGVGRSEGWSEGKLMVGRPRDEGRTMPELGGSSGNEMVGMAEVDCVAAWLAGRGGSSGKLIVGVLEMLMEGVGAARGVLLRGVLLREEALLLLMLMAGMVLDCALGVPLRDGGLEVFTPGTELLLGWLTRGRGRVPATHMLGLGV